MIRGFTSAKEASISARIVRADGSVEDKGVIAYWNSNPLKRIAFRLKKLAGGN